jgi:predicted nucleic acid-binding protein
MILLDSDVLIANLRGVEAARQYLIRARTETGPLAASTVSVAEVAGGMRSAERREITRLLASLQLFPVGEQIAWTAADLMRRYRRSNQGIGLGDYLVAATALVEGLELATLNVRHFPMIEGIAPPFVV